MLNELSKWKFYQVFQHFIFKFACQNFLLYFSYTGYFVVQQALGQPQVMAV